ncbi:MAG: ribonuclease HI family protein [Chloroflexota bacterium]
MMESNMIIFTDGAARGNPGPAAIGAVISDKRGKPIASISQCLGTTTNNQAEYRAIIAALEKAIGLGARQVVLHSDSELAVKQINGAYRVKNEALKPLYQQVKRLQARLEKLTIDCIPRERNSAADSLANQALDSSPPYCG